MSNTSRDQRHFRRRRRRPALLGATAFASVIVLALGGLTLVGLDTVGSKGLQLARVAQPEMAQAPEVTKEKSTEQRQSESGGEKSGGEQASSGDENSSESSNSPNPSETSKENEDKATEEQASTDKATKEQASKDEDVEKSSEKADKEQASEKKQEKEQQKKEQEPEPPPPPQDKTMWMTIPKLGMYSDTVFNSSSHEQMGVGAIKLPPTGFPWQGGANTYISAHRIGYPGTQSYNQFYALPAMQQGDMIYVGDANGTQYKYRVTKKFAVKPWENWVTEPKAGKDMITLQTCIDSLDPNTWWDISPKLMRSGPDSARMIVRAEKVDTTYPQQYQQQ